MCACALDGVKIVGYERTNQPTNGQGFSRSRIYVPGKICNFFGGSFDLEGYRNDKAVSMGYTYSEGGQPDCLFPVL